MKSTQRENAYRYVRGALTRGEFLAGERLYPAVLARKIGVSQVPVREAIGQLQSEGLIVHMPHRGIFVKEIKRRDLIDLIEFRTLLECHAVTNAARRINAAQLRELDKCWQDLQRAAEGVDVPPGMDLDSLDDPDKLWQMWRLADLAFHTLLLRVAGNRLAIRAMEDAHVMTWMFRQHVDTSMTRGCLVTFVAGNLQVHGDIYEAVRRHNAKAARRAMKVHMRRTRKNILDGMDGLQRQQGATQPLVEDLENMLALSRSSFVSQSGAAHVSGMVSGK